MTVSMGLTPGVSPQPLIEAAARLQQGHVHEALKQALDFLAQNPRHPEALYVLGVMAFQLQQPAQALEWLDEALADSPTMALAWLLKARVLRMLRRDDEALAAARHAVKAGPSLPEAWHCVGFLEMAQGHWQAARDDLGQAVQLDPANAVVRSQYALALNETDAVEAAFDEIQKALAQAPQHPELLMTKADILESAGYYDLARDFRPSDKMVVFAQAASVFLTGHCAQGLALIAARNAKNNLHPLPLAAWEGAEDFGLHVLLTGEQGYGDMIQFARYIAPLRLRVGKVSLRLPRALVRLFRYSFPRLPLIAFGDPAQDDSALVLPADVGTAVPPDVGAQSSLMALPQHLQGDAFDPLAETVPYLKADPALASVWRTRLAGIQGPRIGLVWSGNPRHTNDHKRSVARALLAPLVAGFGAHLVTLQKGQGPLEGCFDAAPFLQDFADTAALISELDLLISIDSAPAHLAGALGKPVWTLVPFNPDWRWLLGREDTFWYPSMRLFRQQKPGDWAGVVAALTRDLGLWLTGDGSVLAPKPWQGAALTRNPLAVPLRGVV